jgi:hypothetical protein
MTAANNQLTPDELQKVEWGKALNEDYFYIPVIYYSEPNEYNEGIWYSLRYSDESPPKSLVNYASKVPAGMTLWQAVRRDFEKYFKFPHEKSFTIEEAKAYDTAKTKDGSVLTRVLVWVDVREKLNFETSTPLGLHPKWHDEGEDIFNPIYRHFQ